MEFKTLRLAQSHLRALGLTHECDAPHDHGMREYWGFADGSDAFVDHSATITPLGCTFWVSDFIHLRKTAAVAAHQAQEKTR